MTDQDIQKMIDIGKTPPLNDEEVKQVMAYMDENYSNIRTIAVDSIEEDVYNDYPIEIQFGEQG